VTHQQQRNENTVSIDPNTLLMGAGGTWAKFETPGDKVAGEILSVESRQATDLDGNPKQWDNGDPIMEVVVTLQTEERNDGDDEPPDWVYSYAVSASLTIDADGPDAPDYLEAM
jgi:hypothetical protein